MSSKVISYSFDREQLADFFERYYGVSYKQDIPSIYLSRGYLNFSSYIVNSVDIAQESTLFEDYGYRFKLNRGDLGDPMYFLLGCGDKDLVEVSFAVCSTPIMSFRVYHSDPNKCGEEFTSIWLDYIEGCKELVPI